MSVSALSGQAAPQPVQAQSIFQQTGNQAVMANTIQSAAQEAAETPQQTQLEAAAGNAQAKQLLVQEQGNQAVQAAARAGQGRNISAMA